MPPLPAFLVPPNTTGVGVSTGPFPTLKICQFQAKINPIQAIAYTLNPVGVSLLGTIVASLACPLYRIIHSSTVISYPGTYTLRLVS